jgi:hypothetical protein
MVDVVVVGAGGEHPERFGLIFSDRLVGCYRTWTERIESCDSRKGST